jgi:hypothetical protein
MIKFVLIGSGVMLEISGITTIIYYGSSDWILFFYLLQHFLASYLFAMFGWFWIPEKYKRNRYQLTLLLFNFAFIIPIFGLPAIFAAVFISGYRRRPKLQQPFSKLVMPEFVLSMRETEIKFSQGGIKSRLAQSSTPTPLRLQSLLALQGIPARVSSPLLHDMLGDASDDIRLVAYGLLDSREKKITSQIHRELVNLRSAESKEMQMIGFRHLAELYWEMIYAGLAQGDLRTHALNQALINAEAALALSSMDNGLMFLKGRILLESKRYKESKLILESAMRLGLPESRALPYIVEIAFHDRDFKAVQELLLRLSKYQLSPIMKNAIQFWVDRPSTQVVLLRKVHSV